MKVFKLPAQHKNTQQDSSRAFTIIELIVVISVIGILATVGVYGFGAWRQNLAEAEVRSDLNGVIAAMENERNFSNGYPTQIPSTFTSSEGVELTYASGDAQNFCITATSRIDPSVSVYVDTTKGNEALDGSCTPLDATQTVFVFDTRLAGCANNTVQLPIVGMAFYGNEVPVIYWGDGGQTQYATYSTANHTHTYDEPGEYRVAFNGAITRIDTFTTQADRLGCLTAVEQWGTRAEPTSVSFDDSVNLASVAEPPQSVTSFSGMFQDIPNFNQDISGWDTSNVANMSFMFDGATSFNQPIGDWDTGSVTNMSYMFRDTAAFNQPIGTWNTANVRNMSNMFMDALAFNQPLGTWNTISVTNMAGMFWDASSFNQTVGTWNTANVTDMSNMFYGASVFNQPIGTWNTSSSTNTYGMFRDASAFNQPIGSWNTANVRNMSYMFMYASAFNQQLNAWDTGSVTNMSYMFYVNTVFNQPIGAWDTSSVTTFNRMFYAAYDFNQPIATWNTASATDMTRMFMYATDFNQDLSGWNVANVTLRSDFNLYANAWTLPKPNFP